MLISRKCSDNNSVLYNTSQIGAKLKSVSSSFNYLSHVQRLRLIRKISQRSVEVESELERAALESLLEILEVMWHATLSRFRIQWILARIKLPSLLVIQQNLQKILDL